MPRRPEDSPPARLGYPYPAGLYDHKALVQPGALLLGESNHDPGHMVSGRLWVAKEDDAMGAFTVGEDKSAEVLVFGQENALLIDGQGDDAGGR